MAKDPAFLFYPNDFDSATKFFTDEQVGIYLRLLIAQFQHGRLSEKQVLFISKTHDEDIMKKFRKDVNGLYYSERLEFEITKRKNFSVSRKNNRMKKICLTSEKDMLPDMENENENENKNVNKDLNNSTNSTEILKNSNLFRQPNIPTFDQVHEVFIRGGGTKEMAEKFFNKYESTGWFTNNSPITNFVSLANNFITNYQKNVTKNGTTKKLTGQAKFDAYVEYSNRFNGQNISDSEDF